MSKYIKLEDAMELARQGNLVSNSNFESVCKALESLPTIEVSEDAISRQAVRDIVYLDPGITDWQSEMLEKLPSVIPQVPTEDAISRQAVIDYCLDKVDYFRKRIEQVRDQAITTSHYDDGIKKISYLNSELARYADFATEIDNIPSVVVGRAKEDAISRKDLQELFNEVTTSLMSKIDQKDVEHLVRACVMVTEMIQDAPSVVTDRPKGEWTKRDMDFTCSECGLMVMADFIDEHTGKPTMNFCPNCGAKMTEPNDDTNCTE